MGKERFGASIRLITAFVLGNTLLKILQKFSLFNNVSPLAVTVICSFLIALPTPYILESFQLYHESRKSLRLTEVLLTIQKRNGRSKQASQLAGSLFKSFVHGTVLEEDNETDRRDKRSRNVHEMSKNLSNSRNVKNLLIVISVFTNFFVVNLQSDASYSNSMRTDSLRADFDVFGLRIYEMICLLIVQLVAGRMRRRTSIIGSCLLLVILSVSIFVVSHIVIKNKKDDDFLTNFLLDLVARPICLTMIPISLAYVKELFPASLRGIAYGLCCITSCLVLGISFSLSRNLEQILDNKIIVFSLLSFLVLGISPYLKETMGLRKDDDGVGKTTRSGSGGIKGGFLTEEEGVSCRNEIKVNRRYEDEWDSSNMIDQTESKIGLDQSSTALMDNKLVLNENFGVVKGG